MRIKDLLLASLIFLLVLLSSANAQAAIFGWSDYQMEYFAAKAAKEYWTVASATLYNGTTITNETHILGYGNITGLGHDDVYGLAVFDVHTGISLDTSNYTVDYQAGNITLSAYKEISVVNETNLLLTNASGGDNLTYNDVGIKEDSVVLFNTTSGATVPSSDYTVNHDNGNIVLVNDSSPYNGVNVSANYTYYNESWPVGINYSWYNKVPVNCTPVQESSTQAFIKKIQFLELGGLKRIGLWKGDYVVSATDGSQASTDNIMGGVWYVNNATNYDVISFDKPYWSSTKRFALRVDDISLNSTGVKVNVVCGYR